MALIDEGGHMSRARTVRSWLVASVSVLGVLLAAAPAGASGGFFVVANCKSDRLNYSTSAFTAYASRGMAVRKSCGPQGKEPRGIVLTPALGQGPTVEQWAYAEVVMDAPPGTNFTSITWSPEPQGRDCGYQFQAWAEFPGDKSSKMPIGVNATRKKGCNHPQAKKASFTGTYKLGGRTRVVAKIQCRARSCSSKRSNYLRTDQVMVTIHDGTPPSVAIQPDGPLARGEWVSGHQPLDYDANDNVGVSIARAQIAGLGAATDTRPCALAVPDAGMYAAKIPCPNGPGQLNVDTSGVPEGTNLLAVTADDPGGNHGTSAPVLARIDNTPPARVDVALQGGDGWKSANDFALAWTNPVEPDRAPIVGATYKLCPVGGGGCLIGDRSGDAISSFPIAVPAPGTWTISLWRRDAAGNQTEEVASDPVTLRYDPDPPQLGFEPQSASDPTLVTVDATDKISGVASGAIEISRSGSALWQVLPTELRDGRLVARIDDAALPAGPYLLRARATDQAHNEASTELRLDGQPMALNLPLRVVTAVQAGFPRVRTVVQTVRRHGRRVRVRHRATEMKPAIRLTAGSVATVAGRLVNAAGEGIAGQSLSVLSSSSINGEQQVATVQTDGQGRYLYRASGSSSRTLRFLFAGSAGLLPAQATLGMTVPALTSLKVDHRRLHNGQTVTFIGSLRTVPAPPSGKLVELQVLLPKGWETFRTIRTGAAGHWTARYHFTRTRGVQRYTFRARLPEEAGFPFAVGGSRALSVLVRGPR
jgi:hypothetical protein